ncbi:uncharacterized protein LOC127731011 [Mytilus californianus]|uniref:uncharacterized protein LOC127731011 n=1 Tax=Mytilus californianus TaxID=6549 RepID=UPI002245C51D|nr:uncharacterized protein LOC127731011 [Mytilus californianus]
MNFFIVFMNFLYYSVVLFSVNFVIGQNDTDTDHGTPHTRVPNRLENMRRRSRNQRIHNIRNHVLTTLGFSSPPQIDENMKEEILRNLSISGVPYRAVSQQCYAGSCTLPSWIDEELWNDPDTKTLRLFFDILPLEDSGTSILNATLRLHIKERTACRCFTEDDESGEDDSVRFTVFVSQFLKPLRRRNRVPRMRILDVKMVVVKRDSWINFNVAEAVQEWMQRRRRRHGLEVNVIDSQGFPIDAKAVFGNTDCLLPVDVECQDTSLPVAVQKSLNFSTSPVLEVFTETRPNIPFREKRDIATFLQPFTEDTRNDRNLFKQSVFLKRLGRMPNCDSHDCEKTDEAPVRVEQT